MPQEEFLKQKQVNLERNWKILVVYNQYKQVI